MSPEFDPSSDEPAGIHGRERTGFGGGQRRSARGTLLVLTEFAALDLDASLAKLPLLLACALPPQLLGRDGLTAITPLERDCLSDPVWKSPAVAATVADYLLDGTISCGPVAEDGRRPIEIVSRLYDTVTGDQIWARRLSDWVGPHVDLQAAKGIAARLAAVVLSPGA